MDPSAPASEQPEAGSEVEPEVEPAVVASARKPEPPASYRREQESAPAPMQEEEGVELASAQKQSKRPIKSAPQKKENPLSALAPQYLSLNCISSVIADSPPIALPNKPLPKFKVLLPCSRDTSTQKPVPAMTWSTVMLDCLGPLSWRRTPLPCGSADPS